MISPGVASSPGRGASSVCPASVVRPIRATFPLEVCQNAPSGPATMPGAAARSLPCCVTPRAAADGAITSAITNTMRAALLRITSGIGRSSLQLK